MQEAASVCAAASWAEGEQTRLLKRVGSGAATAAVGGRGGGVVGYNLTYVCHFYRPSCFSNFALFNERRDVDRLARWISNNARKYREKTQKQKLHFPLLDR